MCLNGVVSAKSHGTTNENEWTITLHKSSNVVWHHMWWGNCVGHAVDSRSGRMQRLAEIKRKKEKWVVLVYSVYSRNLFDSGDGNQELNRLGMRPACVSTVYILRRSIFSVSRAYTWKRLSKWIEWRQGHLLRQRRWLTGVSPAANQLDLARSSRTRGVRMNGLRYCNGNRASNASFSKTARCWYWPNTMLIMAVSFNVVIHACDRLRN